MQQDGGRMNVPRQDRFTIRLEKLRRDENAARFYLIEAEPDFLGQWIVDFNWGRIGCDGQAKRLAFPDRSAAIMAAKGVAEAKLSRGYAIVSGDLDGMQPPASHGSSGAARLLVADELDRLLASLPAHRDSRFARIAASLASACRPTGRSRQSARAEPRQRAAWVYDDTEFRIRARIFQLLDELVAGALGPDEAEQVCFRLVQHGAHGAQSRAVVALVPRTLRPALDRPLEEVLTGAALAPLRQNLAASGRTLVGDLVALPFAEVLALAGGRRSLVRTVEARRAGLGLRLNASTGDWPCAAAG